MPGRETRQAVSAARNRMIGKDRKMEKISIIIPAYNLELYIGKCLDSLLAQTFRDFEIYVMDDGSTDRTWQILQDYEKWDARIHAFHQSNAGVSAARNALIPRAGGEYILFYDGDDYVVPDCLERLWKRAKETDADTVLYGYIFDQINGEKEEHPPVFDRDIYEGDEIMRFVVPQFIGVNFGDIRRWLDGVPGALHKENVALWRSMPKRSVIQDNGLLFDTNLKVGEDTCFTTEYLTKCRKAAILNDCLYFLVERKTSAIYTYESSAEKVQRGKTKLLAARRSLTNKVLAESGTDITSYWQGTVVMSVIQLAFLYTSDKAKGVRHRYQKWLRYVREEETQRAILAMPDFRSGGVKKIPFVFLKKHMYALLFLAVGALNLIGYQFER